MAGASTARRAPPGRRAPVLPPEDRPSDARPAGQSAASIGRRFCYDCKPGTRGRPPLPSLRLGGRYWRPDCALAAPVSGRSPGPVSRLRGLGGLLGPTRGGVAVPGWRSPIRRGGRHRGRSSRLSSTSAGPAGCAGARRRRCAGPPTLRHRSPIATGTSCSLPTCTRASTTPAHRKCRPRVLREAAPPEGGAQLHGGATRGGIPVNSYVLQPAPRRSEQRCALDSRLLQIRRLRQCSTNEVQDHTRPSRVGCPRVTGRGADLGMLVLFGMLGRSEGPT